MPPTVIDIRLFATSVWRCVEQCTFTHGNADILLHEFEALYITRVHTDVRHVFRFSTSRSFLLVVLRLTHVFQLFWIHHYTHNPSRILWGTEHHRLELLVSTSYTLCLHQSRQRFFVSPKGDRTTLFGLLHGLRTPFAIRWHDLQLPQCITGVITQITAWMVSAGRDSNIDSRLKNRKNKNK